MRSNPLHGLLLGLVATVSCLGYEPGHDMQGVEERPTERPPGAWQGQWVLRRDPPALQGWGASVAVDIEVWHGAGEQDSRVQWITGPSICPQVDDEACEWAGAQGHSVGTIVDDRLHFAMPLSADGEDPLFVQLPLPGAGRGVAVNAKGGVGFALKAERRIR